MDRKEENQDIWARIVAKCWSDESFKARLLANTIETLEEEGYNFRQKLVNFEIVLVEDKPNIKHWVIPARPDNLQPNADDIITLAAQRLEEQHELF